AGISGTCAYTGTTATKFTGITGCIGTPADAAKVTAGITGTIAVFYPTIKSTAGFTFSGHTIVRTDLRSWAEFVFAGFPPGTGLPAGTQITVDGMPAGSVVSISGPSQNILTVTGTPTPAMCSSPGTCTSTVAVWDPSQNQVGLGGNDITINGGGGPGPGLQPASIVPSNTLAFPGGITGG